MKDALKIVVSVVAYAAVSLGTVTPSHAGLQDVLKSVTPICWFGDQCWRKDNNRAPSTRAPSRPQYPYYVIMRVDCYDDGEHWGHTDYTVRSNVSRRHAMREAIKDFKSRHLCRDNGRNYLDDAETYRWVHL